MEASLKKILRGISLELRHTLEGWHDKKTGAWNPGDLERRLNEIGAWGDRPSKPLDEMPHLSAEDKAARRLVDGYLQLRSEAGVQRAAAVAEFVRESAYTWANRLFALRCMEARSIIEEVILQKAAYAGRSLVHQRYLRKNPDASKREDDGLFAVLFAEFAVRSQELPAVFDPKSPAVALRPSVAALKHCIALLSGDDIVGQAPAADEVFAAPDSFGWAYQYYQDDEKERVDRLLKTQKGFKCEGADIIPKTALYTESYMVRFLVQNSLGALWMGMYPDSKLCERWEYYVKDADRAPVTRKPVREITFLDPAEGSGHFHLEAFDLFYAMYAEEATREGRALTPREIAASILNYNLYGIDIDGRSVQIATAALWMKAKERATDLEAGDLTAFHDHLVATNIRLPKERNHLELFLQKHPEDAPLRPALELVFQGLEHADELGALLQIEELVDSVLRRLKEEADKNKGTAVQTGLFEPTLMQGTLPVAAEDFGEWKRNSLSRLKEHFEAEAETSNPVHAFFGESAGKGLIFFNLLSRRYDIVAANPPYVGSKGMGPVTKAHIKRHCSIAKRDVYLAFILRCIALAENGRIALVTQQSWMFLKQLFKIRRNVLDVTSLELIGHLGAGAFAEISGSHVNVALFVASCRPPIATWTVSAIRATALSTPEGKRGQLLEGCKPNHSTIRYRVPQSDLRALPTHALVYWCSQHFLKLLRSSETIEKVGYVGYTASANSRFIRFVWEAPHHRRWVSYSKGGGLSRWVGLEQYVVDWGETGERVSSHVRDRYAPDKFTLWVRDQPTTQPTIVWSEIGSGSLGARLTNGTVVVSRKGPGVFPFHLSSAMALLASLNSHLLTYLLRLSCSGLEFAYPYVAKAAFPLHDATELQTLADRCVALKRHGLSFDLHEPSFRLRQNHSLKDEMLARFATDAAILTLESCSEQLTERVYGIEKKDRIAVRDETGIPVGEYSLLSGFDESLPLPADFPDSDAPIEELAEETCPKNDSVGDTTEIRSALRGLFEAGPGVTAIAEVEETEEREEDEEDEDASESDAVVGARVPIPPVSFLEELAQKVELHPISVYWLLKEGIECEGWRCLPEERRLTEDRFTVLVLRLLGHRWPKQIEAGESLPAWADEDGVIPLTSGGGETPLFERVKERFGEDFPGGNVVALQREFEEIVGVSLEQWLAGPFFERHISPFKKRPIAWQLETVASRQAAVPAGKGKKKRAAAGKPVFACLVYYHKLDVDLLPKLRTQYVGLLNGGFETEFRTLERLANPTDDQQTRRIQLEQWTDELQAFDRLLEDVSLRGFGPDALRPALRQYGINDALLSLTAWWLRRLSETVVKGPMSDWEEAATKTELHPDLPKWLRDSMSNLNHFCAVLGPKPPAETSFATDPTSKELAPLVCHQAKSMVESSLELGCDRWWKPLDETVLEPLRQEIKAAKGEIEKIDEELEAEGLPFQRRNELGERKHELKVKIKSIKADHDEKSDRARKVRSQIEKWTCPEAETWETLLSAQPLFDAVASLDGQRPPPQSIADFITQESRYAPDINDGVRVNIAPIQKAGLLHADVLDAKDTDKAIADRAEWRADERRWVREGKLPQPGWWTAEETEAHS